VRFVKGRAAWIAVAVLAVVVVAVLLVITAKKHHDDFWRVAVPGYLTGVGTLALATVTFFLLREGIAERKALADAQAQRDREDALREARKVITTAESVSRGSGTQPVSVGRREVIRVVNAGTEPIMRVGLISGASSEAVPLQDAWLWEPGDGPYYIPVLRSNDLYDFSGRWVPSGDSDANPGSGPSEFDREWLHAKVVWIDSRGQLWCRTGPNLPERIRRVQDVISPDPETPRR
jgi:hypothetical protein